MFVHTCAYLRCGCHTGERLLGGGLERAVAVCAGHEQQLWHDRAKVGVDAGTWKGCEYARQV